MEMGALCVCEEDCLAYIWTPKRQTKYTFTNEMLWNSSAVEVRIAIDNATSERIAVKCFNKLKNTSAALRVARREIKLHQSLSHPRLVRYLSHTEDEDWIYLAMELCERGSLDEVIRRRMGSEGMVREAFRGMMEGVEYLHGRGVCHRDIKPENLLFTSDYHPKLADFGLATQLTSSFMHTLLGTPYYLAPEIFSGKYTEKCDIWSAGVVLYYSLRGRRPFTSSIYRDLTDEILTADVKDWEGITKEAVELIKWMMEKDPKKRPTAGEVLRHKWLSKQRKDV